MFEFSDGFYINHTVGNSRVILTPEDPQRLTAVVKCDVRTALIRALSEYLAELRFDGVAGREVQLAAVVEGTADSEDALEFPNASVYASGELSYKEARMTPTVVLKNQLEDGRVVVPYSDASTELTIEVYSSDKNQRSLLTAMIENALNPVEWMSGVRIEMPHYFGLRATFMLMRSTHDDSGADSKAGIRVAKFAVQADCPVARLAKARPGPRIRFVSEVVESPEATTETP